MKLFRRAILGVFLTLAALASTPHSFAEQGVKATGGIITAGAANAAYTVRFDNGESVAAFAVTGLTASGATLTIEVSADQGTTWTATSDVPAAGGSGSTTLAADGQFRVDVAGYTNLRLRVSSTGAGTIGVSYDAVPGTTLVTPAPLLLTGAVSLGVPNSYSSVATALTALAQRSIPEGSSATIQVAAGTYTSASALVFRHNDGARIRISGATPIPITVTGIGSVTGSAGAWSVPLTITGAAGLGIQAGHVLKLTGGSGTNYQALLGAWMITAVSGSTVTVTVTDHFASYPSVSAPTVTGEVLTTVLKFTAVTGFFGGGDTGLIDNVAIVGDGTAGTEGVITAELANGAARSTVSINFGSHTAILGFETNVLAQSAGAVHFQSGAAVTGGTIYNLHAQESGSIFANGVIAAGAGSHNVIAQYGGSIYMQGGTAVGAGGCGILAQLSGSVLAKLGSSYFNTSGFCGWYSGVVQAETSSGVSNTSYGISAVQGTVFGDSSTQTLNTNGIYAEGGNVRAQFAALGGNTANAITVTKRGSVDATSATCSPSCSVFANISGVTITTGSTGITGLTPAANTVGATQGINYQ